MKSLLFAIFLSLFSSSAIAQKNVVAQLPDPEAHLVESNDNSSKNSRSTNNGPTLEEMKVFYNSLAPRIVLFQYMNNALLKRRIICFSETTPPEVCKIEIESVKSFIKDLYPKLTHLLAIFNLLDGANFSFLMTTARTQAMRERPNDNYVQNPMDLKFIQTNIPYESGYEDGVTNINPAPADYVNAINSDILPMLTHDSETSELTTTGYSMSWNGISSYFCHSWVQRQNANPLICRRLILEIIDNNSQIQFSRRDINGQFLKPLNEKERMDFRRLQSEFQTEVKKYLAVVREVMFNQLQLNPYVALVSSADPSHSEVAEAFRSILKASELATKKRVEDNNNLANIHDPRNFEYTKLMGYAPVVRNILNHPTREMRVYPGTNWAEVADNLNGDFQSAMLTRAGIELALLMAAPLICIPAKPGKLMTMIHTAGALVVNTIKTALSNIKFWQSAKIANAYKNFAKSALCIWGPQVAINTVFLYSSFQMYNDVFAELFVGGSGGDGQPLDLDGDGIISPSETKTYEEFGLAERALREVQELSSAQASYYWAKVFGFGTAGIAGAVALKGAGTAIASATAGKRLPFTANVTNFLNSRLSRARHQVSSHLKEPQSSLLVPNTPVPQ